MAHNFTAAFIAFQQGTPLEDIAQTMAIPVGTLRNKARTDGWTRLAAERALTTTLTAIAPTRGDMAERDLAKIRANRDKVLALAQELQAEALELVQALRAGTLRIEKVMSTGATVKTEPSIRDRLDLAAFVQKVADVSYRALGDVAAGPGEGGGLGGEGGRPAALVQIVLPVQVAAPRAERITEAEIITIEAGKPVPTPCGNERDVVVVDATPCETAPCSGGPGPVATGPYYQALPTTPAGPT